MFRCQITGKLSRRGDPRTGEYVHMTELNKSEENLRSSEKLTKIVVEKRERIYTKRVRNEETGKWEDVEIGRGWEIVRELNASEEGAALWASWSDEDRAAFLSQLH